MKDELDQELEVWNSNYPEGPGLTESEAEKFWDEYEGEDWEINLLLLCRCYISAEELQTVLANLQVMITLSLVSRFLPYFLDLQLKNCVIM